jgi:hypothetical protein
VGNDPQEARRWSLEMLPANGGYVAAVAFEGHAKVVFDR